MRAAEDGMGTWARHPVVAGWVAALMFVSRELRLSSSLLLQSSRSVWVTGNPAGGRASGYFPGGDWAVPGAVPGARLGNWVR